MEILIDFITDKENISEIILLVIAFILGVLFNGFGKLLRWLGKLLFKFGIKPLNTWVLTIFKRLRKWIAYKRIIGKLERLEILEIPRGFLRGKSPEKNPELKKVYRMIDEGIIKPPPGYGLDRLADMVKENPNFLNDLEIEINWDKLEALKRTKTPKIKPPKPPNLRK